MHCPSRILNVLRSLPVIAVWKMEQRRAFVYLYNIMPPSVIAYLSHNFVLQ